MKKGKTIEDVEPIRNSCWIEKLNSKQKKYNIVVILIIIVIFKINIYTIFLKATKPTKFHKRHNVAS